MLARAVRGIQPFAGFSSAQWRSLLDQAGLRPEQLSNDDGTVPLHSGLLAFEAAASIAKDSTFGIRYARSVDIGDTGPLGFAAVSAETVGDALGTISRYITLVASLRNSRYELTSTAGSIVWEYSGSNSTPRYQFASWGIALVMNRIAPALPANWKPLAVVLNAEPPSPIAMHERFFGRGLRFERGPNRFSVQAELLGRPMPQANPRLFGLMTRLAEIDRQDFDARSSDFEVEVRALVARQLSEGRMTASNLARAMGITPHTLRTKLKAHALDARTLIADVRREAALTYLRDTDLTMTEIAFALGYSDSSIFTRSCQKWFGRPPSEVRSRGILR